MRALILAACLCAVPALGANPHLPKALEQIQALEEDAALPTIAKALAFPDNTPTEIATAHLYLGLLHAIHAKENEAVTEFKKALMFDSELRLPPEQSPIVVGWWMRAGGKTEPERVEEVKPPPPAKVEAPVLEPPKPVTISSEPSHALLAASVMCGIGSAISLGVGVGVGVHSRSLHNRADADPELGAARSYQRGASSWGTAANAVFIAAGVLLVAAVLLFVLDL